MQHILLKKILKKTLSVLFVTMFVFTLVVGSLIVFGGPADTKPMSSVSSPFKNVDYSAMPAYTTFEARDSAKLSYRAYKGILKAQGKEILGSVVLGSVVLVHGSSGNSQSMHVIAQGFAEAGYDAYALDIRGHGASGEHGQITYIGQLEHDIEDFMQHAKAKTPSTLLGFSSGGGFVLRFAGSTQNAIFDNYVLISPFLSHEAPTYRPNSGGWVRVGIPRIVAITILNRFGITAFNHMIVSKFGVQAHMKTKLTSEYSFAMLSNFKPQDDYLRNIRAIKQPTAVLVGGGDELFFAEQFAPVFKTENPSISVTLTPNIGHVAMTLDSQAIIQAIDAVQKLNQKLSQNVNEKINKKP